MLQNSRHAPPAGQPCPLSLTSVLLMLVVHPSLQAGTVTYRYITDFVAAAQDLNTTNDHKYTPKVPALSGRGRTRGATVLLARRGTWQSACPRAVKASRL